jgi:CheY-like chemotaxis protein
MRDRSCAPETAAAESLLPLGRLRVLLVDDEPTFTNALRRVLQRHHDVEVASDGKQALEVVLAGMRFDVILSDVMMPRMTGLELLEQLVTLVPDQACHFVFLTGGVFASPTQQRIRTLGTRQLEKPVDVAALRSIITEIAEQRRMGAVDPTVQK